MKSTKMKILLAVGMLAISTIYAADASAQDRKLPDGTIIYSDGSRRLPNGTIIYKNGTRVDKPNTNVTLPDGTVVYPERTGRYPRNGRAENRRNLPPGQAKKIYGGSAKDYAPGQQKKLNNHDGRYQDRNNYKGKKGKGKKG